MSKKKQGRLAFKALARKRAELHIDGDIGDWDINARYLRNQLDDAADFDELDVYLNSRGGSVIEGLNIYNQLSRLDATVTVYVGGIAASMGSVIAMAGDRVVMPENALMMVHNPWGGAVGDADELRKIANVLDKMKTSLVGIYAQKTGMESDDLWALLNEETWLTGSEAVSLGFADEVEAAIEDDDTLAALDAARDFQNDILEQEAHKLVASAKRGWQPQLRASDQGDFKLHLRNQGRTEPAPPLQPTHQPSPQPTQPDQEDPTNMTPEEKARAALKQRNDSINQLFAKHTQLTDLKAECLADVGMSLDDVKNKLLDALGQYHTPHGGLTVTEDANAKAQDGMTKALMARAGLDSDNEQNEFRGHTLLMMAHKLLDLRGVAAHGDKMNLVGMAFTHSGSDFANILSNVANKAMLKGFNEAPEVFDQFTGTGNLSDFKITERTDIGHAPSLREVRPGAEYKYITLGDKKEQAQLATFGELFGINRQTIINDDLGAFTRIPAKLGRAARRTVGDLVFEVILNATYDASNSVTGAALSSPSFDKLRTKMATQKDDKVTTPVRPSYLLTPIALEGKAKQVMESEFMVEDAAKESRQPNTVCGAATPVSDYRLDANSATTWYALGDPMMYDALDVLYLDGNSEPFMEQQNGWNTDGTEFKVRIDAAAKLWDKRSIGRGKA
nr:ATP-dependent Clp protease proteolytic subunit [Saccharospirillaceae bacterium]